MEGGLYNLESPTCQQNRPNSVRSFLRPLPFFCSRERLYRASRRKYKRIHLNQEPQCVVLLQATTELPNHTASTAERLHHRPLATHNLTTEPATNRNSTLHQCTQQTYPMGRVKLRPCHGDSMGTLPVLSTQWKGTLYHSTPHMEVECNPILP